MKEQKPTLQAIERLVGDLQKIRIGNDSIEPLMSTYLLLNYINKFEPVSWKKLGKEVLSYCRQRLYCFLNRWFSKDQQIMLDDQMPLLTFISSRPHILKMNSLVLEELGNKSNAFLLHNDKHTLSIKGKVIRKGDILFKLNFSESNRKYLNEINKATASFKEFLALNKISKKRIFSFKFHLLRQLAYMEYFRSLFDRTKPKYILTEFDRYNEICSLIIAANGYGIPTYTQVHGLLNIKIAYAPLVAKKVFCWGNIQQQKFINWGEPKESTEVTGATQLENEIFILEQYEKLFRSKKVIVLATNPMPTPVTNDLIGAFKICIEQLPENWIGLIRIHPSENIDHYNNLTKNSPRVIPSNNETISYEGIMAYADIIVVYNSAFAIDGMIKEKLILQLAINTSLEGEVYDLVRDNIIPSFKTGKALAEYCIQISEEKKLSHEIFEKQQQFLKEYCRYFGGIAANKMIEATSNPINTSNEKNCI